LPRSRSRNRFRGREHWCAPRQWGSASGPRHAQRPAERKQGVVHPGRGTRNALLSLGERRYLEIMAPDPAQSRIVHYPQIREMNDPRLIGWAVHPPDMAAIAKQLHESQIAFQGPDDGSRKRPDG